MLQLDEISLSVIAFFIGFLAVTALGVRSYLRYRQLKSPLSYYFGLTGITFGIGLFFYSVPFMFELSEGWLKVAFFSGDAFIFAGLIVSAQVLWYLQLHRLIRNRWLFLVPVIAVAAFTWLYNVYSTHDSPITRAGKEIILELPKLGAFLWAMLYLILVAVGIYFIRHAKAAETTSARLRSVTLGAIYGVAGIGGVYNNLFLAGQVAGGIAIAYVVVFAIFLISMVTLNLKAKPLASAPGEPPKSSPPSP